ncbi:DUF1398 domain-containing protein [Enterobacter sp. CC120223-11]|uniref:DUF1398 domain-containing protein n=1 Tax=Enterobacter sp. CC120223-11 TaxID=1378073 RepID=UPI000BC6EE9A|nr:DUF1398 family protein [Enterobacter sp. CC120223-11]SNY70931.1 Uncharacterized conserved protein YbcV, DUF1398 family [Enterobacter sp. CC120223-11]
MSEAINNLNAAMQKAIAGRPAVGGFPYLAETLRKAGVIKNEWELPSCQSLYITTLGPVMMPGQYLTTNPADIPTFDERALIHALREDQAGKTTFPEFLSAVWKAGIVRYSVDFSAREVSYYGCNGESYIEAYPEVRIC